MSFTRVHYELYTHRPCSIERKTTSLNQLCSIELSMYSHWAVLQRDCPVRHIAFPYVSGLSVVLPFYHSCLTFVRKDGPGSSQDPPTIVGPRQLLSIEWSRLRTMRGPFLSLGELWRIIPNVFSGCPIPCPYPAAFTFLCTFWKRWCAPPVVKCLVMVNDSIYRSLSPVGNLRTIAPMG